MGWVILLVLFAASLARLWLLGVRGGLLHGERGRAVLGAAGYALQGQPGSSRRACAGERGAADVFRSPKRATPSSAISRPPKAGSYVRSACAERQERRRGRHPSERRATLSRRPAALDRPRQCAGRSCARAHPARGVRLPARGAKLSPGHPARAFLLRPGACPLRRPCRPPSRSGSASCDTLRRTQAGGRWSSRAWRRWQRTGADER